MTARVIAPEALDFIDLATSSHNHTDHLDAATLAPLLSVNPGLKILVPAANRDFAAARLGIPASELLAIDAGGGISAAGIEISGVPSAHEEVERDEQGRCRCLGYVFRFGERSIYHSGDTVLYDGMVEELRRFKIDAALLPINGRGPERRVAGNLWGREAAQLARSIHAELAIPCHFDMFEFNTAAPDEFISECVKLEQKFRVLENGEGLEI